MDKVQLKEPEELSAAFGLCGSHTQTNAHTHTNTHTCGCRVLQRIIKVCEFNSLLILPMSNLQRRSKANQRQMKREISLFLSLPPSSPLSIHILYIFFKYSNVPEFFNLSSA
ncbi:hypothetical protein MATL_G00003030 [Megalops atlanticus]|uniref:Uncharacterized protein n=1 Tax=Megalops atlanticus TaxID=7932 RepID=A0A9D3QK49_MEGAT|nr:hypothetical protein MATL_G00003030 [Megalops atlanticus]